jgi:hypothetical protein
VDVVDKWLNLLEGYFLVHNFFDREKITFSLLKVVPHVKDWWDTYSEQRAIEESEIFVVSPKWDSFWDVIKEPIHPMDHPTSRKGLDNTRFHQYFPYPVHQIGYQRL